MSVSILARPQNSALVSLEAVRLDLGGLLGAADDPRVQRFIDQASAQAATFCRRIFGRTTYRERYDLANRCLDDLYLGLMLDAAPVVSIQAVKVDGLVLAPNTYEADGRLLYQMIDGDRRAFSGRTIVVDYVAGWVLPDDADYENPPNGAELLPADIERAVVQLVGAAASAAGRDMMVKSEDIEGIGSFSYYVQGSTAALPHPEAEATLAQYRRLAFA